MKRRTAVILCLAASLCCIALYVGAYFQWRQDRIADYKNQDFGIDSDFPDWFGSGDVIYIRSSGADGLMRVVYLPLIWADSKANDVRVVHERKTGGTQN